MSEECVPDPNVTLAPGQSPYVRHVLVCISGKTCPDLGAAELHQALKMAARECVGPRDVRVNKTGCLSQCAHGPMVVVYPEGVWYAGVGLADVPEIVEEHLVNGRPVERLLFRGHRPGKNV